MELNSTGVVRIAITVNLGHRIAERSSLLDCILGLFMASQFAPRRILVVDDNRDAADLTAQLLELHGHQALVAYGGKQGVEIALRYGPDVVLLDLGMPEMDGFAVAAALRQVRALDHLVVIAYSAWGDPETRQRVRDSGFDGHTVKPAKFDVLLNLVTTTRRAS